MKKLLSSLTLVSSFSLADRSAIINTYLENIIELSKDISDVKVKNWLADFKELDTIFLEFIYSMEKDLWNNPKALEKLKDKLTKLIEIPKLKKGILKSILQSYPKYKEEVNEMNRINNTISENIKRFITKLCLAKEAEILFNIAKVEGSKLGINLVDTTYTSDTTQEDKVLFIHSNIDSYKNVDLDKVYELEDIMEDKLKELSTKKLYSSLPSALPIPTKLFFSRVSLM